MRLGNPSKQRIVLVFGAVALIALVDWAYINVISPQFSYMGLTYSPPPATLRFIAWAVAAIPSLWMPLRLQRPSQIVYFFLYIWAYIPSSIIPYYVLHISPMRILGLTLSLGAAFFLLSLFYRAPLLRIPSIRIPRQAYWVGIILFALLLYTATILQFGFTFRIVGIQDVYEIRSDYTPAISQTGRFFRYMVPWLTSAINPFLIIHGLILKKPVLLLAGLVGQLFVYSLTGFKSALFSGPLILVLLIPLLFRGRFFGVLLLWGSVIFLVLSHLMTATLSVVSLDALFLRRLLIVPGQLTAYYFEFFSSNPKALLGDSILKSVVQYPYDATIPKVVASAYFVPTAHPNANIWADAFANFGYFGILLFTMLLGAALWVFDSIAREHDYRLKVLMLVMPAFSLSNTAFLTVMLTHGFILVILLIYFYPKKRRGLTTI